jgi:hypothetical protein
MGQFRIKNLLIFNLLFFTVPSILLFAVGGCSAKAKTPDIQTNTNQTNLAAEQVVKQDLSQEVAVKSAKNSETGKFPMGINLTSDVSWSTSKMWINVAKSARDWGYVDKPYQPNLELKLSPQGYPLADAGLWFEGYEYDPGVWQFSYQGSGEIDFAVGGKLLTTQKGVNGTITGTFQRLDRKSPDGLLIPVHLMLRNIDSNNPPSNLKIVATGYDLNSSAVYTQEFLDFIKPFKILRYMDLTETNNSQIKTWSDRLKPNAPGKGVAYEDLIELSNITQKEAWLTIPHLADDDYIRQTAKLFAQKYDPSLNLYLEHSNELWNNQFSQSRDLRESMIAQLIKEEGLTPEAAKLKIDQEALPQKAIVDRLCHISAIFRQEFGTRAAQIKPVLAGQAANSRHLRKGLEHLVASGQQESCQLEAIAIAPYLNTQFGSDFNPTSVDQVFSEMDKLYQEKVKPAIVEHAQLAEQYNLKLYAYEGGQHLSGENALEIKTAAQNDPRMGELLTEYFCFWQNSGGEDFVFFSSIDGNSKYGHWGLKTSVNEGQTVKYSAVINMIQQGSCTQ